MYIICIYQCICGMWYTTKNKKHVNTSLRSTTEGPLAHTQVVMISQPFGGTRIT